MRRSRPGRPISLAAPLSMLLISALALTGCLPGGDSGDAPAGAGDGAGSRRANLENSSATRRGTGEAAFLPNLSGAGFEVEEIDLTSRATGRRTAIDLVDAAIAEPDAPRFEIAGIEATTTATQIRRTSKLTTAALTCLDQKGHLAMQGYVDSGNRYSMAIALVTKADAVADVDLRSCAVDSQVPYLDGQDPGAVPTLAPCVGRRTTGKRLVTWLATTDVMCAALGGTRVNPVVRPLRRGDTGTDVVTLQLALNDIGADLTADGRLGAATVSAVRAFQDCFPVPDSRAGVADEATQSALEVAQISGWVDGQCET